MSTRAMYTFEDQYSTVHVYKHHDGYPEGAAEAIGNALQFAWRLPRFEADEFAAAFVAANKGSSGGLRLCGIRIQEPWDMSSDSEYWYVVTFLGGDQVNVTAYSVNWWEKEHRTQRQIYDGPLTGLADVTEARNRRRIKENKYDF